MTLKKIVVLQVKGCKTFQVFSQPQRRKMMFLHVLKKLDHIVLYIFFLCFFSSPLQCSEYLPNQSITTESCINVLKILTGQQIDVTPLDINNNSIIHIPEALYPFLIQSNRIQYEIHQNKDTYYFLKNGKSFASITKAMNSNSFVLHPDACPTHYGFLWNLVPFIANKTPCVMVSSIDKLNINISLTGNIFFENLSIGSFNITLHIQTDQHRVVSGQINIQIATSNNAPEDTPLNLFDIQSIYLHNVPLETSPDTVGDTGNFTHVQISGTGEQSFNLHWIPINNPHLVKSGLAFMHIAGTKNLAKNYNLHTKFPDVELTFTSSETIFFKGQYDIQNQSNVKALNVSMTPYIRICSKQVYRIYCSFISSS